MLARHQAQHCGSHSEAKLSQNHLSVTSPSSAVGRNLRADRAVFARLMGLGHWWRLSCAAALGRAGCACQHVSGRAREVEYILLFVDRTAAPSLLPILRSQQQGEILALLLGDPDQELSLTEIARLTGAPHPSVFREVERAERAGLVTSRKVGNTRLVRADVSSPYYRGWRRC
jgi:DNA-binding transcriptional ArsR family regulator